MGMRRGTTDVSPRPCRTMTAAVCFLTAGMTIGAIFDIVRN